MSEGKTLLELSGDALNLNDMIDAAGGEIDEQLSQWLEDNEARLEAKLESYGFVMRELEAKAKALKDLAKEFSDKAKRKEAEIKSMKVRLCMFMTAHQHEKVDAGAFKFTRYRPGGSKVVISDESAIAPEWMDYTPKIDTAGIKAALKAGETVEGAELIESDYTVRIS